jgi:hypothetical protein
MRFVLNMQKVATRPEYRWLQDKQTEPPLVYTLRYALVHIYYLHHCHKGICRRKEPRVEIMDPEKFQFIQKNNTREVKTPSFIFMTIIYISKVATLQVGVVAVTTFLKMF